MIETTTKILCDFCGIELDGSRSHLQPTEVDCQVTGQVRITLRKGPHNDYDEYTADLCSTCHDMLLTQTLRPKKTPYAESRQMDTLKKFAQEILTLIRPDRKCPVCAGSRKCFEPAPRPLDNPCLEVDCDHCDATGTCPVPCSHDHL